MNATIYRDAAEDLGITELGVSEHVHRFHAALDVWDHPFWCQAAADDIDEYRIGAQLAAAGRPMVAILPQGVGKSDFGAGRARAFDADSYIRSTFDRLGALGAWPAEETQ